MSIFHLFRYLYTCSQRQAHYFSMPTYGGDLVVPDKALHELLWENLPKYGDDIAIIDASRNGKSITYMELYHSSRKVAAYLQTIGIKKGDFVSICAFGSLEFATLIVGILGSGAIMTPCNALYRKAEILHEFNISRPRLVFVEEESLELMKSVQVCVSSIEKLVVIGKSNEFTTLDDIMNDSNIGPLRIVDIDPRNDIAYAPRSSGTTGLPKCMLIPHRSLVAYIAADLHYPEIIDVRDTSMSMYSDRPLYHGSSFSVVTRNLARGLRTVTAKKFHLPEMFRIIEKYKVTSAYCVPPVLVEMVNANFSDQYNLSSLKVILSGGAAMPRDVAQRTMKKYKLAIVTVYALSETSAVSTHVISAGDMSNSTGKLIEGMEMKVADISTEEECSAGCDGEIRLRGPQIMTEYYKNEAANSAAFDRDGWFKTGDIGHLDDDGNVYIIDRLKEIICYQTNQVPPAQLESVIISHPKVADVGVIGIPHERDGEQPKAFVVPSDDTLTAEEVHQIVNENLIEFKRLRGGVTFVSSIPKSATGKILRKELKKLAGF